MIDARTLTAPARDPADAFRATVYEALGRAPDVIHADGKIHRFGTRDRRGDDSGWYLLHLDGVPAGCFGDWRSGLTQAWSARGVERMTPAERKALQRHVEAARREREAELHRTRQQAADEACRRWNRALPAPAGFPYLVRKGIGPNGARTEGDKLLIAMHDTAGNIRSLQTIDAAGTKLFMRGGQVRGLMFMIGRPSGTVVVCEGFATGATIHEATHLAVAVAFNAGNLLSVAKALRSRHPYFDLVIAADDDWRTDGNPGVTAAKAAALATGADVVQPFFPVRNRPEKATDFNDLHQLCGVAAVRQCFADCGVLA